VELGRRGLFDVGPKPPSTERIPDVGVGAVGVTETPNGMRPNAAIPPGT